MEIPSILSLKRKKREIHRDVYITITIQRFNCCVAPYQLAISEYSTYDILYFLLRFTNIYILQYYLNYCNLKLILPISLRIYLATRQQLR